MSRCVLYPISTNAEPGYAWEWRTIGGNSHSGRFYTLFYDCLEDAKRNGHDIDFKATVDAASQYEGRIKTNEVGRRALPKEHV